MNRTQIMSRLVKLIPLRKGEQLHYDHRPDAPDAEEREAMRARYKEASASKQDVAKRMAARTAVLQAADPDYQALAAEAKRQGEIIRANAGHNRAKIQAGVAYSMAGFGTFHVMAEGDTWGEVFAKLEAKPRG